MSEPDLVIDLTQPIPDWPTEHDVRRWLDEGTGGLRDRLCKAWLVDYMAVVRPDSALEGAVSEIGGGTAPGHTEGEHEWT